MINTPKYLIIHHAGGTDANPLADSSNFNFSQCNELHKQKFNFKSSLGFYIGYHYYIEKDGKITQGRADSDEGAHTIGYNNQSLGICLAGNFDATLPTQAQIDALKGLLLKKMSEYGITADKIVPHRKFASKTCFGKKLSDSWAADLVKVVPAVPVNGIDKESVKKSLEIIDQEIAKIKKELYK